MRLAARRLLQMLSSNQTKWPTKKATKPYLSNPSPCKIIPSCILLGYHFVFRWVGMYGYTKSRIKLNINNYFIIMNFNKLHNRNYKIETKLKYNIRISKSKNLDYSGSCTTWYHVCRVLMSVDLPDTIAISDQQNTALIRLTNANGVWSFKQTPQKLEKNSKLSLDCVCALYCSLC